jgi:SAM-dependent methyltransferase
VIELARRGMLAIGVDFAPGAIEAARAAAGEAGLAARALFLEEDVFALGGEHDATYDLLFEQTCYCAIEPARRDEYAALAARLVAPGGTMLFVVYPAGEHPGGPPFAIDPAEIGPRFDGRFELLELRAPARPSKPARAGKEMFAVLRRRAR